MAVELTREKGGFSLHKDGEAAVAYAGAEFIRGLRDANAHLDAEARETFAARLAETLTKLDKAGFIRAVTIAGFTFRTGR